MAFKYVEIRDQLLAEARRSPHDRLPSEHDIAERYGVSRKTAVKALNALAAAGLVRREVGRGTFLVRSKVQTRLRFLAGNGVIPRAVIERFATANPDVEVTLESADTGHLLRDIVSRSGMTVMCHSNAGFLDELGLLTELDQFPGFDRTRAAILDRAITWSHAPDGRRRCVSLPLAIYPEVLIYNRRMAEDLGLDAERGPVDWADFARWAAAAPRLHHGGRPVMGLSIQRDGCLPMSFLATARGGRDVLTHDGEAWRFDFAGGERWLRYWRELRLGGGLTEQAGVWPSPLFFGQLFMAAWGGTWVINQREQFRCPDELVVRRAPPIEAGGTSWAYAYKPELFIVRSAEASDAERAAAWRLIRFLVEDVDAQRAVDAHFAGISVNRDLLAEQRADRRYRPFIDAFDHGVLRADPGINRAVMKILCRYFYRSVLEDMAPAAAAAAITDAVQFQLEIGDVHR